MSPDELRRILETYRNEALGFDDGELNGERAEALNRYHGRLFGDEKEGRSKVVSRDLSEAVDWIMPALMNIFLNSGNIAEFVPVGPDDDELAQQESDYTNHVVMEDNDGFIVLHDFIKDALLLKNGYVKHYWDEKKETTETEYEGLSETQLVSVMSDLQGQYDELEIIGQEAREEIVGGIPVLAFDVKIKCTKIESGVCIEACPVEEIRVDRKTRGQLKDGRYVEHSTLKTRSELIELGLPRDFVESLPSWDEEENDDVTRARDSVNEESDYLTGKAGDRSMDEIEYNEAFIRVDYDDDGIAELRRVVTVGGQIPEGEEWNQIIDDVGITGCVPKRVPHRHVGESLHDELEDIIKIKTALTRQMLDNTFFANHTQFLVNERVNLKDFTQSLPGGIKRVMDDLPVAGAAEPINVPPILDKILPAIDYFDKVRSYRTGISESSTGLDPDVLRESTKGAYLASMEKASQKVMMIARMLAETGVKDLIEQVHKLLLKYQDHSRVVKMRGKYVEVNPTEWKKRNNIRVTVGIGTGSGDEKRQNFRSLIEMQEKVAQLGMVGPQQAYNMFSDVAEELGITTPERYVLDPQSNEYQATQASRQNQPNPLAEAEMVKGRMQMQNDQMKQQYQAQLDLLKQRHESELKIIKQASDDRQKELDRESKEAIEIMKAEVQAFIEGAKLDIGEPGIGTELNG